MERNKLDYLLKRVEINDLKRLCGIMDLEGIYDFNKRVCECLKEGGTMFGILPPEERKDLDAMFNAEYMARFDKMNQICIKNKTAPLFKDPKNLKECIETREDLIKDVPEEELNAFFGVNSYEEYIPPVYKRDPSDLLDALLKSAGKKK